jgi:hypothetical protein
MPTTNREKTADERTKENGGEGDLTAIKRLKDRSTKR